MALDKTEQSRSTILSMMDEAHKKLSKKTVTIFRTICEILWVTATQKIAKRETGSMYRASGNEQENLSYDQYCGNFLAILSLMIKHDPIVASKRTIQCLINQQ